MIDNFAIAMWLVGAMGLVARHVVLVWSDPERPEKRRNADFHASLTGSPEGDDR